MSYLELLKLAAPEAIVVVTALAVLTIGLTSTRASMLGTIVAMLGIVIAIGAILMLPQHANLFGGMLVISPLNSLFKIICLVLALVTVPLASSEKSLRNPGEYIAVLLLGAVGLMLLVGSEEFLMIFIGFAFKIAAAPFHLWAPDAYQGAPIPSAAFIASGSKVASFVVLGKIVLVGFGPVHGSAAWHAMIAGWSPMLAVLAALSIVVGNLVALAQTNVRRLLAYSAVAHAGYTLLGLVAGGRDGFSATLFYAVVYAITLVGAFGVVAVVRSESGSDDLENFSGLAARAPLLAGCMAIFMFSLAGIPPLAGFFGKFYLFSAALRAGENHDLLWLVALALFGSFVSLYYYLIVLKAIFVDQTSSITPQPGQSNAGAARTSDLNVSTSLDLFSRITITLLAAAVLFLGVMPQTFNPQNLA